jgi:hypothetical protein
MGSHGLKTILDGLVTAGTITQDQENAILNAMQGTVMPGGHGHGTGMTGGHGQESHAITS